MERPDPPLWYPPLAVLPYCDTEQAAVVMAENNRYLDCEAADLVAGVCNHDRRDWLDAPTAIKLRSILRTVERHLRDRGHG